MNPPPWAFATRHHPDAFFTMLSNPFRFIHACCFTIVLFAASGANGTIAFAQPDTDNKEIDVMIQQLASTNFVEREAAASRLVELGEAARTALERASQSADPAIAFRAQQLLEELTSDPDTDLAGEDEITWQQMKRSSGRGRTTLFQLVTRQGNAKLAFRLLQDFPELEQSSAFFNNDSMLLNSMLLELIAQGEWEKVCWVIEHPMTIEKSPGTCYHFHAAAGTLESFIETQFDQIRSAKKSGEASFSDRQILALLSILRITRKTKRFEEVIGWLPANLQDDARLQCQLESGDWKAILETAIDPGLKRPNDGKFSANQSQLAFLQQLAGDQQGYAATVNALKNSLESARNANDEIQSSIASSQLLAIGLTNLDWPLVKANLDPKKEFENYTLMTDLFRYQEAFESIKLGDSPKQRIEWFESRIDQLKENLKELAKLDRRSKEYRSLQTEINTQRNLIIAVADHLGTLGFDDEADLYLQMMFAAEESNFTTRNRVIVALLAHERHATARKLIEVMLTQSNAASISQLLFSDGFKNVSNVSAAAIADYSNPIDQIKAIAELTRSPLRIEGEFDFEIELARYRSNGLPNSGGSVEWHVGQLLLRQGRLEESERVFMESAKSGNYLGVNEIVAKAYREKNFSLAVELLEDVWRTRRNFGEALLAADCYRKLAASTNDAEQKRDYEFKAIEAGFAASTSWHARSYSIPTSLQALDQYDATHLASFLLKSSVYSLSGISFTTERYREQLASVLASNELGLSADNFDSQQAGTEAAINILNRLAIASVESQPLTNWEQSAITTHLAIAKGEIVLGQAKSATNRLLRCIEFHPANSTLGETTIAELDATGAKAEADGLFQRLTQDYVSILTSYPQSALHRNNYAWICACAQRRLDTVDRHIELARKLRPNNSSYADTMAEIKFRNGDVESALELNRLCIMIRPDKPFYRRQREKFLRNSR